jgi:hypothetical protein
MKQLRLGLSVIANKNRQLMEQRTNCQQEEKKTICSFGTQ